MRRLVAGIFVAFTAAITVIGSGGSASADSGTTYVYRCSSITMGEYSIPFSKIYNCSSGPADYTIVHQLSTYTGKQTGWISGECAFYAHYQLGWTNMSTVWSHCLTHKDWPTCGGSLCK